jgi:hypothetical protein
MLKDFEKWKKLNHNKNFSLYDYIFHVIQSKNISTDIYFAFLELFWPSFIIYDKYVFLNENFSEMKLSSLKDKEKIEYWMNLLIIDPYFNEDQDGSKKAGLLVQKLAIIWQTKLEKDFPGKNFIVESIHDGEDGDFGLTFYQSNL